MTDLARFYRLFISGGRNISISFPYFSQQNASHFLRRDTVSPLCASLRFCSNTPIDESGSISAKNERLVLISVILGSKTAEVYDFSLIIFACTIYMIQHVWYLIPVNDCNTQNCKPTFICVREIVATFVRASLLHQIFISVIQSSNVSGISFSI